MNRHRLILIFCALALVASMAAAQLASVGQATGFKLPLEYYPPRNGSQQIKTMMTGSEGQVGSDGMVLVKEPRIESFDEDGTLEWIITTPQAWASILTRSASGTNHVVFKTADTNLFLRGRGFSWQQSNGLLILSNETLTRIDRVALTNRSAIP